MELKDKVAIVTGAARGIGKATALKFSKNEAVVILVDIRAGDLQDILGIIHGQAQESFPIVADVSKFSDVENVVKQTINKYKRIDILVNNAGIAGPTQKMWEMQEKDWDRILAVNLKSMFLFCKLVVPLMIANKNGKIINVASIGGKEGNENLAAYSASKAGVISFSRALAKEVAMYGIRVNSIAPAIINTDMAKELPKDQIDLLFKKIPMGRFGTPDEVAELILFLASDRSSFITGQCFNITGGRGDY